MLNRHCRSLDCALRLFSLTGMELRFSKINLSRIPNHLSCSVRLLPRIYHNTLSTALTTVKASHYALHMPLLKRLFSADRTSKSPRSSFRLPKEPHGGCLIAFCSVPCPKPARHLKNSTFRLFFPPSNAFNCLLQLFTNLFIMSPNAQDPHSYLRWPRLISHNIVGALAVVVTGLSARSIVNLRHDEADVVCLPNSALEPSLTKCFREIKCQEEPCMRRMHSAPVLP